jgi:hypothetical protein
MPQDVAGVMREFDRGQLHSGSHTGPRVTNRKQAIAIGLSEQKKRRGGMPGMSGGLSAGAYGKGASRKTFGGGR